MEIGKQERGLIGSILDKVSRKKGDMGEKIRLMGVEDLARIVEQDEWQFCQKLLDYVCPADYGLGHCESRNTGGIPGELVPIRGQWYRCGDFQNVETQFLPPDTYEAFLKLNRAMRNELGAGLILFSGFRSIAYQFYIFLYWLRAHNWDFLHTLQRVALPGWSEHGDPSNPAIDVMTVDGIPSSGRSIGFETTAEFRWLTENVGSHGFRHSFPKNNGRGKIFEPWHVRLQQ